MGNSSINLMPSCHGSTIIIVIFVFQIFFYGVISDNNDIDKMKPVEDLVQRIIPQYADQFSYILNSNELGNNAASFCILSGNNGKNLDSTIQIQGSDVISIVSGINFYLNFINASISWDATGGNNLEDALPPPNVPLPKLDQKMCRETTFEHRYYFNVCTYGYSMVFWDWMRWEKELDWMALHSINTPLASLGTEYIWVKVLQNDFGISMEELSDFFPGPAYLPWHWMGNLDGWNGPLPSSWIERGRMLQHKFLSRARSLGMLPVLPAFAGFVPSILKKKFPNATIHDSSGWGGFNPTSYLDPTDPLFQQIGAAFVRRVCEEYGCDEEQWFSADPYNELTPPSTDPGYIKNASSAIYSAIAEGIGENKKAIWLAQAWMWESRPQIWGNVQIEAFLNGPPLGNLVMLDLYAEVKPIYVKTKGFFNHPWIFSTIFNFGGRSGLYGRLDTPGGVAVTDAVEKALLENKTHKVSIHGLKGLGAAPEAIETDPIMYDILFASVWGPIKNKDEFVKKWAIRRYKSFQVPLPNNALQAWALLKTGPYACQTDQQGPSGSLIASRPDINIPKVSCCAPTTVYYNSSILVEAWRQLLIAGKKSKALAKKNTYLHDVADVGVQVLSNLAVTVHSNVNIAIKNKNQTGQFKITTQRFLNIINDTEILTSTQKGRIIGEWILNARNCAEDGDEKNAELYELNARTLVTLWGDKTSHLHEYSYRLWGGLVSSFYYPRWKKWFDEVGKAIDQKQIFNQTKFVEDIETFEEAWTHSTNVFPSKPSTDDAFTASLKIFEKYYNKL